MTYFLLRDYNIQPKRELLESLLVSIHVYMSLYITVGISIFRIRTIKVVVSVTNQTSDCNCN